MTVEYADVRAHIPINSSLFRRRIIHATYFPYFKHWNKYMIVPLCTYMYLRELQRKTLRIKEVLETPRLLDQDICTTHSLGVIYKSVNWVRRHHSRFTCNDCRATGGNDTNTILGKKERRKVAESEYFYRCIFMLFPCTLEHEVKINSWTLQVS